VQKNLNSNFITHGAKKSKNLKIRHKRAFSMIGYCLKCLLWDSPPPFKHFSKRHGFGFCGYYSKNLKIRFLDSNNSNFITHIINGTKWDTPSNAMYSDLNAICLNCPVPSPHPPKNQNEKVREGFGVYIFYS